MAIVFALFIQCGEKIEVATEISRYYHGMNFRLSTNKEIKVDTAIAKINDDDDCPDPNYWCIVDPLGITSSGINNLQDAQEASEAGFYLLDRLKVAPPFNYAVLGTEIGYGYTEEAMLERKLNSILTPGLILNQKLWKKIGMPSEFTSFRHDYMWIPYLGEVYEDELS